MSDIEAVLGADGPLARALAGFRARPVQQQMAARVEQALRQRQTLIVEAGTGIGKTYAYLVPALLSGLRVLISTGTRTLQDQLYHRDLPLLTAAIGRPARVALLKGRSNYLCRARLTDVGRQAELLPGSADPALAQLLEWSRVSASGDLAELPALGEAHPLRARLTSTRDSCTGRDCPEYARCHVVAARRAAQEADISVVNHHLLLADLALKEEGFGDLLPSVDAVILDEAHQLPDLASEFFGVALGARPLELLLADLTAAGIPRALTAPLAQGLAAVRAALGAAERSFAWRECAPAAQEGFAQLERALARLIEGLEPLAGGEPGVQQGLQRARALAAALAQISGEELPGARTVTVEARGFVLRLLPYDISERFRALVQQEQAAWIFTSATLAVAGDFSHFAQRLGLQQAECLSLPSPFDYPRQALLYLPQGLPPPTDARFIAAMLAACLPLIEAAGGGAFLLFTSHRALREAARLLAARLPGQLPLLVQGSAPREQLLRQFRAAGNAVLLGSASFWEGVDVQGAALRLVIIDKLPFASPEDPVVAARIAHLTGQGANAFRDYQLPEAVLALKQGVGRLIRSEADEGVVTICDARLTERAYGRVFVTSLPPMRVTREAADAQRRLAALREQALLPASAS